jgi:pyrimidine operon attenuation protein / uracil phosphoribosyltransferase
MAYGRPRSIRFCCMIDRGHRELPVSADYVGLEVPTHADEEVLVKVKELDGEDSVYVIKGGGNNG